MFLGLSRVPPTNVCLIRSLVVSFCLKEPIRCYVNVDTSVVCYVLMHCLCSFIFSNYSTIFTKPEANNCFSIISELNNRE